jgi:hypothetical protein
MVSRKGAALQADVVEIRRTLDLLLEPGQVAELRVLKTRRGTAAGYFTDFDKLAQAAAANSGKAPGVYVTLNPVNPDLLARSKNRFKEYVKETTADRDILKRRWFPIDFDANRPAGISSTEDEHEATLNVAWNCREWLGSQGWPEPIFADSGNGAHLLYMVDLPSDDDRLVERCLKALAPRFSDTAVSVDVGNYNPARIWKIYGTLVAKGDSVPERPHRLARILEAPEMISVTLDKLEALASTVPGTSYKDERTEFRGAVRPFDLGRWIADHGLIVMAEKPWGDGRLIVLDKCPFNPDHTGGSAVITESGGGTIGFKCHHNSCESKHWRDVRELFEPGAYSGGSGGRNDHTSANDLGEEFPQIQGNYRQVRDISEDCVDALIRANDPAELFVRGGAVARVRPDEKGRPIIDNVNESVLAGRLTRTADFIKMGSKGVAWPCPPPQEVVKDILAIGQWPFPPLAGVVEVPTLRPDGSILATPGYDLATGLFYLAEPSLIVPPIPESPSTNDVQQAVSIVDDVLADFPFVDQASRANAWAVLLTTMIRHAIPGRVPLCLCDAPKAGTGKGLFTGIISVIATGRLAAMFSSPGNDEEWRKQLTSALLIGATMIIIDNLEGRLDSASLSRALTAPIWADRILSTNTLVHLPNDATWLATGNNIALGGDMPRRCYLVRMDARHPKPWERTGFRHTRLEEYVTDHRGELVAALLTIIRGWYAASCPMVSVPPFGGFEAWAETTAGILAYAGVEGFLANLPILHSQLDQDTPVWATFFEAWHDLHRENPIMVATVTDSLKENDNFLEALPDNLKEEFIELMAKRKQTFKQKLGGALRVRKDSVYPNGLQLIRATDDPHKKVARWAVVALELAGTSASSPQGFEPTAGSCGEQQPLPTGETQTDNSSWCTSGTTPRNSPQSCLESEEISGKSPQDPWENIDDDIGI